MIAKGSFVSEGSTIALIAPGGTFDPTAFKESLHILEKRGYKGVYSERVFLKRSETAGAEWQRSLDFINYMKSPEVDAIWCIRGGYGSLQILKWLPSFKQLRKPIIGYSDITFLHLYIHGLYKTVTFHGPNFIEISKYSEENLDTIFNGLSGKKPFQWNFSSGDVIRHGRVQGRLIGGNLTCLCHLLGTPYLSPEIFEGTLLFLEDVNEKVYQVDRMFYHLQYAGILKRLGALILGNFKNCGDEQIIMDRLASICQDFNYPIVKNFPAGHIENQILIPLGSSVVLETYQGILKPIAQEGLYE